MVQGRNALENYYQKKKEKKKKMFEIKYQVGLVTGKNIISSDGATFPT